MVNIYTFWQNKQVKKKSSSQQHRKKLVTAELIKQFNVINDTNKTMEYGNKLIWNVDSSNRAITWTDITEVFSSEGSENRKKYDQSKKYCSTKTKREKNREKESANTNPQPMKKSKITMKN